ncbi:hypothetical protein [Reinekea sp.]|uniref:hypothetical protein n=1 Tax=Reinekea sp. TaxID=1970455 RepID=UPI002A825A46|nr:hypothetical protein [Reinekea sp.]
MLEFGGIAFTVLEQFLVVGMGLLGVLVLVISRRMARLEARSLLSQAHLLRELKMVNQGAIGMGRRLAGIEANVKKSSKIASFAEAQELKHATGRRFAEAQQAVSLAPQAEKPTVNVRTRGLTTRAEQALSSWINEHKTA